MSLTAVPNTAAAEDEQLEMLRINIRHRRKEKGLSFRFMPVHTWDEAIILARLLNVRRVACVLGLNVEELKRRMEGRQPGARTTAVQATPDSDGPGVIDLPGIALTPPAAPTPCPVVVGGEQGKVPTEVAVLEVTVAHVDRRRQSRRESFQHLVEVLRHAMELIKDHGPAIDSGKACSRISTEHQPE